ncbi:MAG: hypothetical protein MUF36_03190 [Bacteroidales bacterium]|jgi:hypothetical protein|nr:hypothetical protein [Bacteroidales bacterium]
MYLPRKLKQDNSITGLVPALICLSIGAVIWVLIGPEEALLSVAAFYFLYAGFSFWIFLRTRNMSFLAASMWQLLFGVFLVTRPDHPLIIVPDEKVSGMVVVLLLASTVWLLYFLFTKRAKWKGREVFELASMAIEPLPDGFTERPRPAGSISYTRDELMGFSAFLNRNLVAMPYYEDNSVVFVPVKMGDEFSFLLNREKFRHNRSWIAFDFHGNVTVNISRKDYLDYKEELSFDQLCGNFGNLFIQFMEYYRKGEAERILYKLNELGLGLTS